MVFTAKQKAAIAKKRELSNAWGVIKGYGSYRSGTAKRTYTPRRTVRGYGKYQDNYGSRLGSVLGEGAERVFNAVAPAGLRGLAKIIGFGDYAQPTFQVKKNSLLNGGNDPPEVKNSQDGRTIIRHREYIMDVITGSANTFKNTTFPINPGVSTTFPWLATVAQAYEQYRLRGMIFEFKSTSADALNSTNTALGTIIMATEYDSNRANFVNKQQAENHQFASSARQSCSMYHPIECDRSQTPITELYVRTTIGTENNDNDTDLRFTDWGKFQLMTTGQQASNVTIGELWCTYEIELIKPAMNEIGAVQQASFYYSDDSTYDSTNFFGDVLTIKANKGNTIPITFLSNTIRWPKGTFGTYLVLIQWIGDTVAAVYNPAVTGGTAQGVGLGYSVSPFAVNNAPGPIFGQTTIIAPGSTENATQLSICFLVRCDGQDPSGNGPSVVFSDGSGLPADPLGVKIYICSVMDGLVATDNPDPPMALALTETETPKVEECEKDETGTPLPVLSKTFSIEELMSNTSLTREEKMSIVMASIKK